jgi:hypothetical protein
MYDNLKERLTDMSVLASTRTPADALQYIEELEANLAKAVDALGEAIYLLDPDEEDIAKETGLHRIVTTYAELTGGKDAKN